MKKKKKNYYLARAAVGDRTRERENRQMTSSSNGLSLIERNSLVNCHGKKVELEQEERREKEKVV